MHLPDMVLPGQESMVTVLDKEKLVGQCLQLNITLKEFLKLCVLAPPMIVPFQTICCSHILPLTMLVCEGDIEHSSPNSVTMDEISLKLHDVVFQRRSNYLQRDHAAQWDIHLGLSTREALQILQDLDRVHSLATVPYNEIISFARG
jgi:hypothetical protein